MTVAGTVQIPPTPGLAALRWLLFLFFGGIGSLLPFVPLHALSIGLTLYEAQIISIVSPLIALLGPAVAGPLVDYVSSKKKTQDSKSAQVDNRGIRGTLATTILLAAICYSLLLAVPAVERFEPRQPAVSFLCSEKGALLVQERCNELEGCYQYPYTKNGSISLTDCRFDCSSSYPGLPEEVTTSNAEVTTVAVEAVTTERIVVDNIGEPDLDDFFGDDDEDAEEGSGGDINDKLNRSRREDSASSKEAPPPHICHGADRLCNVYTASTESITIAISLKTAHQQTDFCSYQLGGYSSCRIPSSLAKEPSESCRVVCDLKDAYVSGSVLQQSQCSRTIGDPDFTFWLYICLRGFGDLFTAVSISLLIGGVLSAIRVHIGREFLTPALAYAMLTALSGYLQSPQLSPIHSSHIPFYFFGIAAFAFLSVISVFILIFSSELPIGPPDWWSSSRHLRFRHKAEFAGLLLVLTLLGILWGPHFSLVPLHLAAQNGLEVFVGCSLSFGALVSLPFVWKADFIIDYCGYANILIASFTFYILRYTGLLFLDTPWVLFITGGLEVFTLCLMMFSSILYIRQLVPKYLSFTAYALGFAAHFCLGNSLGCLIATFLSPSEETLKEISNARQNLTLISNPYEDEVLESPYHLLYCSGAVFSAVVATIYYIVYHCCLKKKCLASPYRKANNASPLAQETAGNGTYTPLRSFNQNGRQQQRMD